MTETYDYVIVGGGIVGLATATALLAQDPGASVAVLEKESSWAAHQSGRNSGVVHSGIYYRPGSLKATLARAGRAALRRFCENHELPYEVTGKLIVATTAAERNRLRELQQRATANGVETRLIDADEIAGIEPHAAGEAALHVPSAAIVDYRRIAAQLAANLEGGGATLQLGTQLIGIRVGKDLVTAETTSGAFHARMLINCAGLFADRLARMAGVHTEVRIVPFRGEYFELKPERWNLVRTMIYPVPPAGFPFLGVHLTRTIGGGVHLGPSAVLALRREGYMRGDPDLRDAVEILSNPGLWRLASRSWRMGLGEILRAGSRDMFARQAQRLVPSLQPRDLVPAASGVRAQALTRSGRLVDDFLFASGHRSLHVLNAPSPAATASLSIGEEISSRALILLGRTPAERSA